MVSAIGRPSTFLLISLWMTKLCQHVFTNDILMDGNVRLAMDSLCPEVDICDRNAIRPVVKPNGILNDVRQFISCCQGCSCHEDCHDNINCCFPDAMEQNNVFSDKTSLFPFSNRRLSIPTDNEPTETIMSTQQCLYGRTGTPSEHDKAFHPAFRMVVKPPPGGCKTGTAPNQTKHIEFDLPASCEEQPVMPWGELLPAYSKTDNMVYKNPLCAQCHGVYDYEIWSPELVCKDYDLASDRYISLSEHFDFFRSGTMSKSCYVSFLYNNVPVLMDKRCYVESIMTCAEDFEWTSDGHLTNLSRAEIKTACHSGLHAPLVYQSVIFMNVFCALCNVNVIAPAPLCSSNVLTNNKGTQAQMTYLLDISFIVSQSQASQRRGMSGPIVCLRDGNHIDEDVCKTVHCPTGQFRKASGQCEFLSKMWFQGTFLIPVMLKYVQSNGTSLLSMLNKGLVKSDIISESFRRSIPWPNYVKIEKMLHSDEDESIDSDPVILVDLLVEITPSKVLVDTIRTSLKRRWNVVIGGVHMSFEQSFMTFSLDFRNEIKPWWTIFSKDLSTRIDIPNFVSLTWSFLLRSALSTIPHVINKLIACEHVSLYDGEYTLLANKYVLISNLTNRVLFDREFELVEDGGGKFVSRVCVQDTRFEITPDTNRAFRELVVALPLVPVLFLVKYICMI